MLRLADGEIISPKLREALSAGPLLFNFSASYSGGGYKRLRNYAKWFDAHGGAYFIIHRKSAVLAKEFPGNRYFVIAPGRWARLWRDGAYLESILSTLPQPALYYSYGIPLFARFGRVNWFHLSNALPLAREHVPMSLADRLKFTLLGQRIRCGLVHADVIAAESEYSLDMIGRKYDSRLFVSSNGFDECFDEICRTGNEAREDLAVVVGTYRYKALDDAFRVFGMLRAACPQLRLRVFGPSALVPPEMRADTAVELLDIQPQEAVVDALRKARHYISTSRIENSSNADLEGAFLSENAWLSNIGPHREMLNGSPWNEVAVPGVGNKLLHVRSAELSIRELKPWRQVIEEMLARFVVADVASMSK
jgi:glycosyltransferase involved in cell wall biosynthesis